MHVRMHGHTHFKGSPRASRKLTGAFKCTEATDVASGTKYRRKGFRMRNETFEKPRRINWVVVAGEGYIHPIQMYDLVFDEHDMRIRQLA